MDLIVKVLQAEFTLPGDRTRRQNQGKFELHSTVATYTGELDKLASIWLDGACGHSCRQVGCIGSPVSAFIPVRPNTKTSVVRRTAILSRRLEEAVVNLYVGRICFEAAAGVSGH